MQRSSRPGPGSGSAAVPASSVLVAARLEAVGDRDVADGDDVRRQVGTSGRSVRPARRRRAHARRCRRSEWATSSARRSTLTGTQTAPSGGERRTASRATRGRLPSRTATRSPGATPSAAQAVGEPQRALAQRARTCASRPRSGTRGRAGPRAARGAVEQREQVPLRSHAHRLAAGPARVGSGPPKRCRFLQGRRCGPGGGAPAARAAP